MLDSGGDPGGAFMCGEEIGLQRSATDDWSDPAGVGAWLGFRRVDSLKQVAVSVEERAVDTSGFLLVLFA
jgi:hypothetical protein